MKWDLTSNLIFFWTVSKVKYIKNYKAVFDFKHMGLFVIHLGLWDLGIWSIWFAERGVIGSQRPGDFLWVSIFRWNEKKTLIWYKDYVLRMSYVEKFQSSY